MEYVPVSSDSVLSCTPVSWLVSSMLAWLMAAFWGSVTWPVTRAFCAEAAMVSARNTNNDKTTVEQPLNDTLIVFFLSTVDE
jgi:hypothetical protein